MPVPFLNKHSEEQYLELEKHYLNLHSAMSSLLTITEGEDLDTDSQRLIHFNALCTRVNEIIERFDKITKQVQDSKFKGDSATTSSYPESAEVVIYCTKQERDDIIEALENYSMLLDNLKISDRFKLLASEISESKKEVE
ncbi:MAG: hypothetical protein Unbinned202contig1002_29 [Prokaryotic dsDNA virus sp.]|nr:MAG: hypothetical protein Unbinned202contig1002_29 [Prokaryotic dsDNA virus sp.]|tara:strand:+ start:13177 stop:13596 length:420 start_codon:yes stop_codon:yes gene_type:complete